MSDNFAKYIKIGRYKCFENFSAEGFKRVNLISGKNNVGKTALMEALYINVNSVDVPNLLESLWDLQLHRTRAERVGHDLAESAISSQVKKNSVLAESHTNLREVSFEHQKPDLEKLFVCRINTKEKIFTDKELNFVSIMQSITNWQDVSFIPSVRDSQEEIINSYISIQEKDQEPDVNEFIHRFDDSIENVKVIANSIQCKVPGANGSFEYRDLNEFGDGLRHYLSVIADIFAVENGYIFIDELDNGIHYSLLDELWEIILTLSKELNVQVFATTHSKECIESYCRIAEKLDEKDVSLITLVKNKEKQTKAIVRDYKVLTDSIHDNREVRGW